MRLILERVRGQQSRKCLRRYSTSLEGSFRSNMVHAAQATRLCWLRTTAWPNRLSAGLRGTTSKRSSARPGIGTQTAFLPGETSRKKRRTKRSDHLKLSAFLTSAQKGWPPPARRARWFQVQSSAQAPHPRPQEIVPERSTSPLGCDRHHPSHRRLCRSRVGCDSVSRYRIP